MKHRYLRCPICGKLSRLENFQVHRLGGRHELGIMVQEISSKGRGKIRNKWYPEKISAEKRRELKAIFEDILSHVLDDLVWDGLIERKTAKVVEDEVFDDVVEKRGVEVKDDGLVVEVEDDGLVVEVEDDESVVEGKDDDLFGVVGDDDLLSLAEDEKFEIL